jgi:hypothetical protein
MVNGRNKGSQFELSTAKALFLELGIGFKRDLEQTRTAGHADLIPDDPAFPFVLELKRYKSGPINGPDKWWEQVCTAAERMNKRPALIYKYDRQPVRVVVEMHGIRCNISFEDFSYLCRETMAHDANF